MDFERHKRIKEAILNDKSIESLVMQKQKIMNSLDFKYVFNKSTNTISGKIFDKDTIEALSIIDAEIERITEKIKKCFI